MQNWVNNRIYIYIALHKQTKTATTEIAFDTVQESINPYLQKLKINGEEKYLLYSRMSTNNQYSNDVQL